MDTKNYQWNIPIKEFWRRQGLSLTTGQKLVKQGIGPRLTRIGALVFVTIDDEQEWRKMMQNPHGKAAEVANANAAMLHDKAKHAWAQRKDQK